MELKNMNGPQTEAVRHTEGPLLVLAGAGSGKTRVLTHRAAFLIEEGTPPWNILCITFTNKAAREMRERIDRMVEKDADDITVSTFHSLCLRILFRYADLIGYDGHFEICDASDQKQVMKQVMKDLQIDTKKFKERAFLNAISAAKDELKTPADMAHEAAGDEWYELCAEVYKAYQRTLQISNSMDFDDLIMQTVRLFNLQPQVLEHYQDRFRYIMVDEYQDTNTAQFELIRLLAAKYRNLCVVGDDDQSIYRFRGANIRNILDFEKHYPEAHVVRLEQNYRSTQNILDAANAVISNNTGRKKKTLWTDEGEGKKLSFSQLETAADEARFVADDIVRRVRKGECRYGDCAVLMRTNVQSKEFEDAFRLRGIDYDLVKGLRFWDTKVIKDLTSYLLTVYSGANDMRTIRIINLPSRGIGNASIEKIRAYAVMHETNMLEACRFHSSEVPGLGRAASKARNFAALIYDLRDRMADLDLSELVDEIISATGYDDHMQDEAETDEKYREMLEYVDKLKEALDAFQASNPEGDLIEFMCQNGIEGNNIDSSPSGGVIRRELSEEEEAAQREKKVLIMTMHNAKGLEFPNVYLVGMEEGLFPGFASIFSDDPEDIEEERRLCYVAITRARENLTLLSAKKRMTNGETRYNKTSRFIKEIPLALLQLEGGSKPETVLSPGAGPRLKPVAAAVRKKADNVYTRYSGQLKKGLQKAEGGPGYSVGDMVRHVKFGDGRVMDIRDGGRDWEVTVEFENWGVKKMFAAFAALEKL